ncbi:MAG: acetylornithine transaminase [Planctomycetota bacterium]
MREPRIMDEHVLPTYRRHPTVFTRGRGTLLMDEDGNQVLDFLSGLGVTALGHSHPRWVAAVREQAGELVHVSNLLRHPFTEVVAERLARLSGLHACFFSNSGTEANECALKIARAHHARSGHPQRTAFLALQGGFHGRTFGSLSVTAHAAYRTPFGPALEATFLPPGDAAALQTALAASPAALILEPVQGEGGLNVLSAHYLQIARKLCDESGTLLICDEVQCGAGRTGTFLAASRAGVTPDLATLAKPLGGGLPMGVTLVRRGLTQVLAPGDHGTTFGGGPLVLAAALVFLEELEEGGLSGAVQERGRQLAAGLERLVTAHPAVTERRGLGLMQGLVIPGHAAAVQAALLQDGLLAATAAGDVLRFLPPYTVSSREIERALLLLDHCLSKTLEQRESCKL